MSPMDRQLQTRPKTFKAVDVTVAAHVLAQSVIDRLVPVAGPIKTAVGGQFVGMNDATRLNALGNKRFAASACGRSGRRSP